MTSSREMWQMCFNPSKCTVIRASAGKKRKAYYTLHGQLLEVLDSSKYLGVTVTDDLSWSKHISDTAAKANRSLGFLQRNFNTAPRKHIHVLHLYDQSWSIHLLCGTPTPVRHKDTGPSSTLRLSHSWLCP